MVHARDRAAMHVALLEHPRRSSVCGLVNSAPARFRSRLPSMVGLGPVGVLRGRPPVTRFVAPPFNTGLPGGAKLAQARRDEVEFVQEILRRLTQHVIAGKDSVDHGRGDQRD